MSGVTAIAAVLAFGVLAAVPAGAQTDGGTAPTPGDVLSEAAALTGTSIADATNAPDAPYTPAPTTQTVNGVSEEANSALTDGVLQSEIILSGAGVRTVARVKAHVCPDTNGSVTADVKLIIGDPKGGDDRVIDAKAVGHVNDGAHLASSSARVVAGKPTAKETALLVKLGKAILEQAEKGWRNGLCVKIEVSEGGSRMVKPKEQVAISATAKPRAGGGTITTPMTARQAQGKTGVKPSSAAGSPAKFTYTGPPKKPGRGSVELKSTSKRGIGITTLEYTTEGDLQIDALYQGLWHLFTIKCGGPAGGWNIDGDPDVGSGHENITFTLDTDSLSGSWHSTGQLSVAGATRPINEGGGVTFKPSADGTGGTLTFSPDGGSVPVVGGKFCIPAAGG